MTDRAAQQRAAIRRVTEALTMPLPASDVYQLVLDEARRLTEAASAALCFLAPGREMVDFVAVSGENAEQIVGLRIRLSDSLSEPVVATGQPLLLDNRATGDTEDLSSASVSPLLPKSSVLPRCAAVVPIYQNKRLIGTLSLHNKMDEALSPAFDSEDVDILTMLAEITALAMSVERTSRTAREQSRELAVLYDAARTVAGSLNISEVMESVLAAICTHLEYHTAILFLLNDEHTHLFIAAERGLAESDRDIQLSVEMGAVARVLESGQPRLVTDSDLEGEFEGLAQGGPIRSAMIAPIRSRDETHGIIVVNSLQGDSYSVDELSLLGTVAMQAGIAMENAWLYEDARRQAEEAAALYDLSQHVNATLHLDNVLNFVAESVVNLLKVDKFALMLFDPEQDRLVARVSRHLDEAAFGAIRPRAGEGIAGWVYEWQTPQAVSDVAADPRNRTAPIDGFGVASTLCVPMHAGEEVIGVIHAMNSKRRLFTVAEMELLYTIANQAAVALWNAILYQEARSRSHDMRRYFRRVAHAIGSSLDEQDLPQLMADLSVELMRADRCAIYRVDGDTVRLQASSRFRNSAPPEASVPVGVGLCGWVARRGQSLVVTHLEEDARSRFHSWLHRDRLSSYLAVPVKAGRRTVGVLEVYTHETREFSKEEVQVLSTFARRAKVGEKLAPEPVQQGAQTDLPS